ncbi:MAG TPA: polysaccharide deacetylase family protein [Myxococcales bacterium]
MRRAALVGLLLAAACVRGKPEVPILNYHSVAPEGDEFTVAPPTFERELDWLVANGYRTVSLHDLLESRDHGRRLPERSVILTFDDGKEDALRTVLPALRKRGMRGTFFVITGAVGRPGYLTWDGVRALAAAGMEIGSHTVTHARLADLDKERVDEELRRSRAALESELGRPIEALAYPYNSVRASIRRAAGAAGYRVAVAGADHGSRDVLSLRRATVTGAMGPQDLQSICKP